MKTPILFPTQSGLLEVKIGDLVFRPIDHTAPGLSDFSRETNIPLGFHWGTVVGRDQVITAGKPGGPEIVSFDEFATGLPVLSIKTHQKRKDILLRKRQVIAKGGMYNLAFANCEHVATEVAYGQPISSQVLLARLVLEFATKPVVLALAAGAALGVLVAALQNQSSEDKAA